MAAGEVTGLAVHVFPEMTGFRSKMMGEAQEAGKSSGSLFARIFSSSGKKAGENAGRSLRTAFRDASKSMSAPGLNKLDEQIRKITRTVSSEHLKMLDAQGKVRVAQAKLNDAVSKYGKDSTQAITAQERLNSAQRKAEQLTGEYNESVKQLKSAQADRNELEKAYAPANYRNAIADIKTYGKAVKDTLAESNKASKAQAEAQKKLEESVSKYGIGSKQAAKAQQELAKAEAQTGKAESSYTEAVRKLTEAQERASKAAKDYQPPKLNGFQRAIENVRGRLSKLDSIRLNGLHGAFQKAGEAGETLKAKISAGTVALGSAIGNAVTSAISSVKEFAQDCISSYNEASEGIAKFDQIAANNHWTEAQKSSLDELGESLKRVGVIDDDVTRAGQAQLGTFKLNANAVKTLTPALDDMVAHTKGLNATSQDAVTIGNLMGKVMTGQTGALQRYGVTMDANQKKLLQHGSAEQRAAMLAKILEQNYGGVNRALAQTPAGKIKQLQNNVDDLKKSLGRSFTTIVGAIAPSITAALNGAQKPVESFAAKFTAAIKGISGALRTGNINSDLKKAFGVNARPILDGIKDIKAGFKAAIDGIKAGFRSLSSGSKDASQNVSPLAEIFKTLGGAIKLVGQVAGELGKHLKGLLIIGTIAAGVTGFVKAVQTAKKAIDAFKTAQALLNIVMDANPIGLIVIAVAAVIAALVVLEKKFHIFEKAGAAIKKAWKGVSKFFQNLGKNIGKAFQNAGKDIQKHFSDARKGVEKKWKDIGKWFQQKGKDVADGFKNLKKDVSKHFSDAQKASTDAWSKTPSWFKNSVAGKIVSHFVDFPSKISKFFRDPIGTIRGTWNGITSWFGSVPGRITGFFRSIPGRISGFFRAAGDKVKGAWRGVVGFFRSIPGKITGFFRSIPSKMGEIGRNIVEGLKNGISNSIGSVARVITGGMHHAIDSVKHALGIHSPSTVMRDQVGRYIGLGMAEGIRASMPAVASAMEDMAAIPTVARVTVPRVRTVDVAQADGAYPAAYTPSSMSQRPQIIQNFPAKIVRSDDDLYTAYPIIYRTAMNELRKFE